MGSLLDSLVQLDTAARIGSDALGKTKSWRQLRAAARDLRRVLAPLALHQQAETFDSKADLKRIFAAAEAAGLSWQDLRDALNTYHEHNTGNC